MHFTLRVCELPEPAVTWIPIKCVPPAFIASNFDQMASGQSLDSLATLIANRTTA